MNPPDQNIQYIKINESQFYRASTSSTMVDVDATLKDISSLQKQVDNLVELLQGAADKNVSKAVEILITINSEPLSPRLKGTVPLIDKVSETNDELAVI